MPNSIDFRADQIQTKQIIVTGSGAGTTKLLIYGIEAQGSPVNEGEINQSVFPSDTAIGGDVFLYVSGALNTKGSATKRGTSVFGGDLVVSGSLYNGAVTAAGGNYSHAEGFGTLASQIYSHAEGYLTTGSGEASHAEGDTTKAQTKGSHTEGLKTYTFNLGLSVRNGYYAHTEGSGSSACGDASHAEGYRAAASGAYSHAEGQSTIASGYGSHAEGDITLASGFGSHAEGQGTTSAGNYSHAEGYQTNTVTIASHAEGLNTTTSGAYSHAEGYYTKTESTGLYAHAEGYLTTGSGEASHAEGNTTKAIGFSSHAEGYQTIAFGTGSHASGYGTIASGSVDGVALSYTSILQTATGRFNARGNTTSLFVVGNGTGDADVSRKDLFSVDSINQEGMVKINGGISYKVGYLYYVPLSSIDYILTLNDYLVIVNVTAGGPFSVYLPPSATTPIGTTYVIRRLDGGAIPYANYVRIYCQLGDYILDNPGNYYSSVGYLQITGNAQANGGGCVSLTYAGNYADNSYGTNPTWITTSELYL